MYGNLGPGPAAAAAAGYGGPPRGLPLPPPGKLPLAPPPARAAYGPPGGVGPGPMATGPGPVGAGAAPPPMPGFGVAPPPAMRQGGPPYGGMPPAAAAVRATSSDAGAYFAPPGPGPATRSPPRGGAAPPQTARQPGSGGVSDSLPGMQPGLHAAHSGPHAAPEAGGAVPPGFVGEHRGGAVTDAQLNYYGKLLASAGLDCTIAVWDVGATPRLVAELVGHEAPVLKLAWAHPRFGRVIASGGADRRLIVWRQNEEPAHARGGADAPFFPIYSSSEHTGPVHWVHVAPAELGLHVACASSDGTISVHSYNAEMGSWTRKAFDAHPHGVLSVCWAPLGPSSASKAVGGPGAVRLVSGGCDNKVRLWQYVERTMEWVESAAQLDAAAAQTDWVTSVAWKPAPQGPATATFASGSLDGTVQILQEADGNCWKLKQTLHADSAVTRVAWSITGSSLAVTTARGGVSLFKENTDGTLVKG